MVTLAMIVTPLHFQKWINPDTTPVFSDLSVSVSVELLASYVQVSHIKELHFIEVDSPTERFIC